MASDRDKAKSEITSALGGESTAFQNTQRSAQDFRKDLASQKETHRHEEYKLDLGSVGKWLGGAESRKFLGAFAALFAGILLAVICIAMAALKSDPQVWFHEAETIAVPLITLALGYMFGKSGDRK